MSSRFLIVSWAVALGGAAFAQQTTVLLPAQAAPNTIVAEASDILRAAPDIARVTFSVVHKDPVAETASEENEKMTKELITQLGKLKIANLKVTSQAFKISKVESENNNNPAPPGGGVVPMMKADYRTVRTVTVALKDANPEQLQANVAAIQKEAAKMGIAGDSQQSVYNGFGNERQNVVRVAYGLQNGWDDKSEPTLAALTKRAMKRATALAEGAGMKVIEVVSITESHEPVASAPNTNFFYGVSEQADDLADGELVQKIRVRVTVKIGK